MRVKISVDLITMMFKTLQFFFLMMLHFSAIQVIAISQDKSKRTKVSNTKSRQKSVKNKKRVKSLEIDKLVTQVYEPDDISQNALYEECISNEAGFKTLFPKRFDSTEKIEEGVVGSLQTSFGKLLVNDVTWKDKSSFYKIIWYTLPNYPKERSSTSEILRAVGFENINESEFEVLDESRNILGRWFERGPQCAEGPLNHYKICFHERFFIKDKRLYRLMASYFISKDKQMRGVINEEKSFFLFKSFQFLNK